MRLCLQKEKIYVRLLDLYLPEYQTVEHRLELRKDLSNLSIRLCYNLVEALEKNR